MNEPAVFDTPTGTMPLDVRHDGDGAPTDHREIHRSYGTGHEEVNRAAIELRYRLLPHVYNEMRQTSETGVPALRPLFLEFPDDPQTWGLDHQYLFGGDLLVAPVLEEGATERWVYLPAGEDDGLTFAYRDGVYLERTFHQRRDDLGVVVEVGVAGGGYRPPARDLELRIRWEGEPPRRVLLGDRELAGVETADGWVVVRAADRWEGWRVRVEP